MNPSEQHDQEDLERRLRDAFAAKALQVSDADLDRDREEQFAAALNSRRRTSPMTRIFAGVGAAAAAAAIVGVTVVALHDGGKHEVVNGLSPAMSSSSASPSPSTTGSPASTGGSRTPALNEPVTPRSGLSTQLPSSDGSSAKSSAARSGTTTSSASGPSALTGPSTARSDSTSTKLSAAADQPPAMSPSLPQASPLSDQEYAGAVPLESPSGGPRMLAMPSDLTWQRTAESDNSLTVRITYLPTDLEAYWQQTLPGEGWIEDGSGWSYPGTSYTVSAISDKGSFTVTW